MEELRTVVALFAKPPIAGRSKSRLAAQIGAEAAAALSAAMLEDLLGALTVAPNLDVELHYVNGSSPEDFPEPIRTLVPKWRPQQGVDLGERMLRAFELMLGEAEVGIVIGSDCISLSAGVLRKAAAATFESDVVLQPADDGGYTLIASRKVLPAVFQSVDWGSSAVLEQSIARAYTAALSLQLLDSGFDVDEVSDLEKLAKFCAREPRPATMRWLEAHYARNTTPRLSR